MIIFDNWLAAIPKATLEAACSKAAMKLAAEFAETVAPSSEGAFSLVMGFDM